MYVQKLVHSYEIPGGVVYEPPIKPFSTLHYTMDLLRQVWDVSVPGFFRKCHYEVNILLHTVPERGTCHLRKSVGERLSEPSLLSSNVVLGFNVSGIICYRQRCAQTCSSHGVTKIKKNLSLDTVGPPFALQLAKQSTYP